MTTDTNRGDALHEAVLQLIPHLDQHKVAHAARDHLDLLAHIPFEDRLPHERIDAIYFSCFVGQSEEVLLTTSIRDLLILLMHHLLPDLYDNVHAKITDTNLISQLSELCAELTSHVAAIRHTFCPPNSYLLTDAPREANDQPSLVERENDPPSRAVKLFDEIDALPQGAKQ
ncbi:hypothetical protein [Burkholderia cenocepacia]|uniref:hypothetical protein n=1 Tax=Burkholderia cenocepacia TaxID=95486 RepID=UPI000488AF5F|nr:hypothetical protein [Burkholderia cenocepacia]